MQYDHDKQLADLLASHREGCDAAFAELRKGFSYLVFEVAEKISNSPARRLELMAFMYDEPGSAS